MTNTKLGQGRDSCSSDNGILQYHTVVDVADVLCGLGSFGALGAQQVEYTDRKLGELAIFNELAEMRQG